MNARWQQLLDGCAVALTVVALAVAAWPIAVPSVPPAVAMAAAAGTGHTDTLAAAVRLRDDSLIAAVVRGNLFSASRRAPAARYVAPGQLADVAPSESGDPSDAPEVLADPSFPQLLGIVSQDGVLSAMVQVRDSTPPRLLRAGETLDGVRVRRVTPAFIVISTANGTRTVRLARDAASDSTGMLP